MAKVRLLNDGGLGDDDEEVKFPVVVKGAEFLSRLTGNLLGFKIAGYELERVGFTDVDIDHSYFFSLGGL